MKFTLTAPLRPFVVTQRFDETGLLDYYRKNGMVMPGHNGVDLYASHGAPIYASHDGLAYYEIDAKQGHGIVLITKYKYEYGGKEVLFKSIYWHIVNGKIEPEYKSPVMGHGVNNPLAVKRGDVIGYVDNTGLSTGNHLHWGVKPCLEGETPNTWFNLEQNNGYYGAIDPMQFFIQEPSVCRFNRNLCYGAKGNDVMNLQALLIELEYLPTDCMTGYFGWKTLAAVISFQKDRQIFPPFGYVGEKTRTVLNNILS